MITVILPAYKQEKTIVRDITQVFEALSRTRWEFEIVVVVDGFLDKTFEKAKTFKKKNVRVMGYKTNKGKGFAVRHGMGAAKGEYIVFIDGGMEIDPNGISMVLEHMEWYNADIIVGSKRHPASKTNYPRIRKFYSWGYSLLTKILFGLEITDTQTGLKVFKKNVLDKVLPRLLVKKFAFDIEMLSVAYRLGFSRIYEAPINIKWDVTDSSFDRFLFLSPQIRDMLYDTFAVFYRLKILKYYDDGNKRKWIYDKELGMRINTGEFEEKKNEQ